MKNLPTTPESAALADNSDEDPLDYAQKSQLSKEVVDRIVDEQKKCDEKHKEFSKRRT